MKWTITNHALRNRSGTQVIRVKYKDDLDMIVKVKTSQALLTDQVITPTASGYTLHEHPEIFIKVIYATSFKQDIWNRMRKENSCA
ncbi:TPA: hypothetical protein ACXP5Z_004576 [Klebsiella pneumoniae]